jgi:hypothetical protein
MLSGGLALNSFLLSTGDTYSQNDYDFKFLNNPPLFSFPHTIPWPSTLNWFSSFPHAFHCTALSCCFSL